MAKRLGLFAGIWLCGALSSVAFAGQRNILPGDLLEFSCENEGAMCVSRVVNFDGKVLLPIVGPVGVATLTPSDAEAKIEALLELEGEIAHPKVTVQPRFMAGEAIGIEGAVAHPIHLRFAHGIALGELLRDAELTDLADLYRLDVSHADGSEEFVPATSPLQLVDGDRVTVLRSSGSHAVEVVGGVVKPCQLDYRDGLTLKDALDAAGGFAPRGIGSRITVERMGETIPVSLPDDESFPLQMKDQVRVEVGSSPGRVVVEGCVGHGGLIDLVPGMTVSQAIEACGGIKAGARSNDTVWLRRNSAQGFLPPIKLSYRFILSKRIPDPVLSVNDVIHVGVYDLKSVR